LGVYDTSDSIHLVYSVFSIPPQLQDDKVFSYYNHSLEKGYPKDIQLDFPGVPSHLDAAVECPKGECNSDSVLFFKGKPVNPLMPHIRP
jgi:hypothetical protein